ncbi:MAG: SpoIIE family protein phosphatase, partial [Leptospiraceae bacterium]|nr:SpoIIE family protein phosphatase [Leptospiraceae bacterium]
DIRYMVSYNLDENSFEHDIKNPDIEIEKYTFSSILKSALIVKLNKFENEDAEIEEDFPGELTNDPYVKAYWGFLYKNAPLPQTKISLLNFIPDANTKLFYKYNKIKDIPIKNFKEDSLKYLEKQSPSLTGLYDVLVDYIQKSDSDNKSLKKEVMSFFRPAIELNNRNYTLDRTGKKKFVIFHTYFPKYNKIYHTAYSYAGYREFLHEIGVKIFYIFILGVLFFVVGIPLFLSKALVKPLNDLMEGVKKVRKGNLENEVPVRVYDEIGFLALAFNHMVDSIREAKRKLKEYADSLEDKVEERTNELKQTLTQVESLKEQQDGDYFLTTLLLKPFFINEVYDSKTKIDFFVKQKKEFSFRKKQYQIGGDICISQMIELRGRKYIVFLNADAMGKSMQGAGGILVLGAVFQSIIQRTISYKIQSEVSPERWIKMAFKEMHKIFESFDGSMLVSILFGLIEDSTGLVYYINAEHPWLILYRDGVASFIEKELAFRKLGHVGVESEIFVSTFQMEPGDTLIMGSDGKDDLVLDKNPNSRNINEDEFLILKRIEESKGDLNLMFNIITEKYELVDDYSIMSFSYPEIDFEQEAEIQEKIQTYLKKAKSVIVKSNDFAGAIQILEKGMEELGPDKLIMESLIKLTMKVKNYKKAADYCKILLNKNEVDTSILFKASYCLKMNHEFEESIEMSERVKLREPGNIRNLIHLADLYAYTKNYHRSEKLLSKILKFDPNNKQAKLIYEKIQPNN